MKDEESPGQDSPSGAGCRVANQTTQIATPSTAADRHVQALLEWAGATVSNEPGPGASDLIGLAVFIRRLSGVNTNLSRALLSAQTVIDEAREDLHQRRIADWYPEGANNAALQMSEDMRLIGNALSEADFSAVLANADGAGNGTASTTDASQTPGSAP